MNVSIRMDKLNKLSVRNFIWMAFGLNVKHIQVSYDVFYSLFPSKRQEMLELCHSLDISVSLYKRLSNLCSDVSEMSKELIKMHFGSNLYLAIDEILNPSEAFLQNILELARTEPFQVVLSSELFVSLDDFLYRKAEPDLINELYSWAQFGRINLERNSPPFLESNASNNKTRLIANELNATDLLASEWYSQFTSFLLPTLNNVDIIIYGTSNDDIISVIDSLSNTPLYLGDRVDHHQGIS